MPRGVLALEVRHQAQRHRHQQWASRFRLRLTQQVVEVSLPRAALRQGVGHAQFRWLPADQLLERMVELSLRTEEHL